ncbi:hypothetical protein E3N88_39034 [Mikania micrantha]|uniref:Integrase catalytic domain-containing protein n=1 Tax=Mikania micrantha TaxID=192012 RepID=A0A5N6LVU6_9ASTR|nr:hypothetical protein E3N88_39034 [Mikania micrantha]
MDALYNVHCNITTAKELWESLDKKYRTEDAGTKKFVVARFLDYKMVGTKTVLNQIQELQIILSDIHYERMTLSETFQVAAMIEKLSTSWVDFKNYVKHKRKEMTVEDLVVRLRIEEDSRLALKITQQQFAPKAIIVEHGQSSRGYKKKTENYKGKGKGKGLVVDLGPKKGGVKKQVFPFKGKCFNCGEHGHHVDKCKAPKHDRTHMMEDDMPHVAMVSDITTMMEEINLVSNYHKGWWVDTGATRHVCPDRALFNTFKEVVGDFRLYMGKATTADVKSKRGMFVGKGYAQNGMFKLNVIAKVENMNENASTSACLIELSNVWHGHLGHVNFNSMRRLIKLDCIPKFAIDSKYKCTTCVEAKQTRSSFKSVERITKPLDIIHTDVCDLKSIPTRGGNMYFITFIDDSTQYCYVYLLKSKDEAIDKFVLYKTEVENQLNKKIKVLRSDKGGEYVSPFADICAQNGIIHECTTAYSPQQNEKVVVPPPKVQRIGPKTVDCVFFGYAHYSSAYRFLVYDSKNPKIHKNTIMESRNASIFEEVFPCLKKELPSSSTPVDEIVHDDDQKQLEAEEVETIRSKRQRIEKTFGPDFLTYMVEGEPQTYRDVVTSSEGPQWKEAIKNEID